MRTHPFSSIVPPSLSGIVCLSPSRLRKKEHSSASCDLHGAEVKYLHLNTSQRYSPETPVRDLHFHLKPRLQREMLLHCFFNLILFSFSFALAQGRFSIQVMADSSPDQYSFLEFTSFPPSVIYLAFTLGAVARFASHLIF